MLIVCSNRKVIECEWLFSRRLIIDLLVIASRQLIVDLNRIRISECELWNDD